MALPPLCCRCGFFDCVVLQHTPIYLQLCKAKRPPDHAAFALRNPGAVRAEIVLPCWGIGTVQRIERRLTTPPCGDLRISKIASTSRRFKRDSYLADCVRIVS